MSTHPFEARFGPGSNPNVEVAEWSKAAALGAVPEMGAGSNPVLDTFYTLCHEQIFCALQGHGTVRVDARSQR